MEPDSTSIVCAHANAEKSGLACEHLLQKSGPEYYSSSEYFRLFTGRGLDVVLLCPKCAQEPATSAVHRRRICDGCVQDLAVGTRLGDVGTPEIKSRHTGIALAHRIIAPFNGRGSFVAGVAKGRNASGEWLLLSSCGQLMVLDGTGKVSECANFPAELSMGYDAPRFLTASEDGRFVALVNTYGRRGVVIDLDCNRITMELDRGDYRNEHCRFSVSFFEHAGTQLIVHATDWNRLDISDPASGRLITERGPTSYQEGQERPAHYLDYFHCGLSVSPSGDWIAGNGWVWHPIGVVTTWNLKRWLTEDVWESEDGPSLRSICGRDYFWDGPLCWVDDRTLAVWGLGEDDVLLIPGVRLFNVESGLEVQSFVGPVGGNQKEVVEVEGTERTYVRAVGSLMFDRWLFSWAPERPFSVWDVSDGARLLEAADFNPMAYHHGTKEFLSILPDGTIRISNLTEAGSPVPISNSVTHG